MYRILLAEVLPEFYNVPVSVRNVTWFQHDWAPIHFCIKVRNHLNALFDPRWVGRGGPVAWSAVHPIYEVSTFSYGNTSRQSSTRLQ
ncbi:hypothetical protein AVEN_272454-1 [Araneus ventricosus]|uniref:Uncharacterized protein n=1 Tax=Araneus ventricosus TaxID=182803 RepID=A0A4Y2G9T5_ARAVE|nr:hypothetical protein AVEN_96225-1 [Araneus ventricosus]GBM50408.1 hypothetical protein AVEN_272454-1 [Araneus ventricosus]